MNTNSSRYTAVQPKPFQQPITRFLNNPSRLMPYPVPNQNHTLQPNNSTSNHLSMMVPCNQQIASPIAKQNQQFGKGYAAPSPKPFERNWQSHAGPSGRNNGSVPMEIDQPELSSTASVLNGSVGYSQPNETSRSATKKTLQAGNNRKMRVFTGSVEKLIKYHGMYTHYFCLYEVIGLISIDNGTTPLEKILIVRDRKGPILKVSYFDKADHIKLEDFFCGQVIRAVGRMVGPNKLHAICIRQATHDEISNLPRMCYISEHGMTKALASFDQN